jgi:site-specific DNA-adenine methylase
MNKCNKKLKELIEDVVLPDIEDHIDDLFEEIADNKKSSKEDETELQDMHEMRTEFQEILNEIDNDELEPDECEELLAEITEMLEQSDKDANE